MRPLPAALAVACVLLAAATGALAQPPKDAVFELDDVEYMYITGVNRTGTAVLEPAPDASQALPIESCAFVQVHPGSPFGVVRVHGLQEFAVDLDFRVDQLRLPNGTRGYAFDQAVVEDGLPSHADLAFAGNGSMRVRSELYVDPRASTGDPALDQTVPDLLGTLNVLSAGVRDDTTGAILPAAADGDAEMHMHLRSNPDAAPATVALAFDSGPVAPGAPGSLIPATQAYGYQGTFPNLKFGGQARWDIRATSYAGAGATQLTFTILAPNGTEVANATVMPALLQDDTATVEFPLAAFGAYTVRIFGSATLANYQSTLTLSPPEAFDLHLWWESVTYGYQAYKDYRACMDALGTPNSIIGTERVVGRPDPPQYPVVYAILGVAGGLGVVTAGIKLAADQLALGAFRKSK